MKRRSWPRKPLSSAGDIRVRSLSIHEAGFRSVLGGNDCSSRTYFFKALNPNYNYFTQTDSHHRSDGHATIVLGEAQDANGGASQTAFLDKLQNVPNASISAFLEAVRQSVSEKGYALGIPEDVGNENGLSNESVTRQFVHDEILSKLKLKRELTGFASTRPSFSSRTGIRAPTASSP